LILTHPVRGKSKDKVLVELIEADVDIGFGLVDDAKVYRASGQAELTSRALQNAAGVLADVEERLKELEDFESGPPALWFQSCAARLPRWNRISAKPGKKRHPDADASRLLS
jgi:hypothetical protein